MKDLFFLVVALFLISSVSLFLAIRKQRRLKALLRTLEKWMDEKPE